MAAQRLLDRAHDMRTIPRPEFPYRFVLGALLVSATVSACFEGDKCGGNASCLPPTPPSNPAGCHPTDWNVLPSGELIRPSGDCTPGIVCELPAGVSPGSDFAGYTTYVCCALSPSTDDAGPIGNTAFIRGNTTDVCPQREDGGAD